MLLNKQWSVSRETFILLCIPKCSSIWNALIKNTYLWSVNTSMQHWMMFVVHYIWFLYWKIGFSYLFYMRCNVLFIYLFFLLGFNESNGFSYQIVWLVMFVFYRVFTLHTINIYWFINLENKKISKTLCLFWLSISIVHLSGVSIAVVAATAAASAADNICATVQFTIPHTNVMRPIYFVTRTVLIRLTKLNWRIHTLGTWKN